MTRKQMTEWVGIALNREFSPADWMKLKSGGTRWEKTARWAISNLKRNGLIQAVEKNQYRITTKGSKAHLERYPSDIETDRILRELRKPQPKT